MRQVIEVPSSTPVETGIPPVVQTGSIVLVLAVAVVALWRIVTRVLFERREQNKQLVEAQTKGMSELGNAVKAMDTANQLGLQRVTDAIGHATTRIDRHEQKLDKHDGEINALDRRLTVVESGKSH